MTGIEMLARVGLVKTAAPATPNPFFTPANAAGINSQLADLEARSAPLVDAVFRYGNAAQAHAPGSPLHKELMAKATEAQNALRGIHAERVDMHRQLNMDPHLEAAARNRTVAQFRPHDAKPVGFVEEMIHGPTGKGGRMGLPAMPHLSAPEVEKALAFGQAPAAAAKPGFLASMSPRAKALGAAGALAALGYGAYKMMQPSQPQPMRRSDLYT
jgi:hypothetical protein